MTDLNLISLCAMNTVALSLPLSCSLYFFALGNKMTIPNTPSSTRIVWCFFIISFYQSTHSSSRIFSLSSSMTEKKDERWVYECRFTSLWAHCHFYGRRNWINVQQKKELHNLFSFLAFLIWVSARTSSGEREWEEKNKNETNEMKWEKLRRWRSTKI